MNIQTWQCTRQLAKVSFVLVFLFVNWIFFSSSAESQVLESHKSLPKVTQKIHTGSIFNTNSHQNSDLVPKRNSEQLIGKYLDQASRYKDHQRKDQQRVVQPGHINSSPIPFNFVPWWDQAIRSQTKKERSPVGVDWLVQSALQHSPVVRAIRAEPQIRESQLCQETAAFDWTAFLETSYDRLNDPIGNTLTTGNNENRFIDQQWSAKGGVRRRNPLGGEIEIGQRFGRQRNNSIFLDPNPQGTSRLELNYTQPLMNGGGRVYNQSRIVIAQLAQTASSAAAREQLQDHLFKVTEAYWRLYRAKARFQQRRNLLGQAISISESLDSRRKLDAQYGQILRAKSAVAKRQSELARIETDIRNAEAELRLLVNDPALVRTRAADYSLADAPSFQKIPVSMSDSISTALQFRPDISQAIQKVSSASVRLGVAKNELLPRLDLVMGTYLSGLAARGESLNAWNRQFTEGGPGLSVGLQFEVPLGNRAVKARHRQRQIEFVKVQSEFESSVQSALNEVEFAVREVRTSYRELTGKYLAMTAAGQETKYLTDRFKTLPGDDASANLMLEQLLESQERLADEEFAFVNSQVAYSVSLVNLRKAMGTLMVVKTPEKKIKEAQVQKQNALPLQKKSVTKRIPHPAPPSVSDEYEAIRNEGSKRESLKAQPKPLRAASSAKPLQVRSPVQPSGKPNGDRLWSNYRQAPQTTSSLWSNARRRSLWVKDARR